MNRVETRVQLLMAVVGSFLALVVFTPQLFAEDPPVLPPGANYPGYNSDLTWQESGGAAVGQPGKVCIQQMPCLALSFCYTPYNAIFGGIQYQSMKDTKDLSYGLCQVPLAGPDPGANCAQLPTVACAEVNVYTLQNCGGQILPKIVYRSNACSVN